MKIVIQKVLDASVTVNKQEVAKINSGLLVFLGITDTDTQDDINWLCHKIINLRIFIDDNGVMNKSLLSTNGDIILVSQFTLYASTKKGNRPSYTKAARPDVAKPLYLSFIKTLESLLGKPIQTGVFGAHMDVCLTNNGPVTIAIDSKNKE